MTIFENKDYVEVTFRGEVRQSSGDDEYWYMYDPWTKRRIVLFKESDVHSSVKLDYPEVLEPGSIYRDARLEVFTYEPSSEYPHSPWLSVVYADENERYNDSEIVRPLTKLFQGASKVSE
jgi:hypothetical protein